MSNALVALAVTVHVLAAGSWTVLGPKTAIPMMFVIAALMTSLGIVWKAKGIVDRLEHRQKETRNHVRELQDKVFGARMLRS